VLPIVPRDERPATGGAARRAPQFLAPEPDPVLPDFGTLDAGTTSGYGEIGLIERVPPRHTARVVATNGGGTRYPWGIQRESESITHETSDDHPEATSVQGEYSTTVELPGRTLKWEARLTFRSDRDNFYYTYFRRLLENGTLVREKTWEDTIPRDFQ
jgi:hypothetical protein